MEKLKSLIGELEELRKALEHEGTFATQFAHDYALALCEAREEFLKEAIKLMKEVAKDCKGCSAYECFRCLVHEKIIELAEIARNF